MSESISDMYFRLGLDVSDLQDGFIDADRTISTNIRRLNREQNLIQLRAQIELNGLEEAADSTEGLRIQQEALARQIEVQRSKISLVNAAYQEMAATQGENAEVTQQLLLQLERERLALSKLESQTRSLNEQQKIALGMNFEMLGLIEPAMKGIDNAIAAGRNIPIPHAKAVAAAAIGILSIVAGTIEKTSELRENNPANVLAEGFDDAQSSIAADLSAINADVATATETINRQTHESGENVRHYAQEVSASYEDYLQDFLRLEQILTADTETLNDALHAVDSQLPFMKTELGKLGAIAFGLGKSFEALKNSAIEFARPAIEGFRELSKTASELNLSISKTSDLVNTARLAGGEFEEVRDWVRGIQDAVIKGEIDDPEVLALEKYNVVIQDSMGNLLDFETTHNRLIEGAIRAAEAGELETYALMTQGEGIHSILPYLKSYVQAKQDANKIRWSTTDEAALKEASNNMKLATVQAEEFGAALSALGVPLANMALESNYEWFKTLTDLIEDNRDSILLWEFAFIEAFKRVDEFAGDAAESIIDKIKSLNDTLGATDKLKGFLSWIIPDGDDEGGIFDAAQKALDEYIAANKRAQEEAEKTVIDVLGYNQNRVREYKRERAEINRELEWGDNSYQKSLADLNAWREEAMQNAKKYFREREAIAELYDAKRRKIEADRARELQNIRDSVDPIGKTEFQRRLIEIEKERQAWINLGMTIAESFELAQKKINQVVREREDRLNEIRNSVRESGLSELEKQYAGVDREARSWVTDGMSEVEALQLAEQKKLQIRETYVQKAQEMLQEAADREYGLTHDAFEKQLYDVERWKQAQLEKAQTAEEVAATIADAAMKEAEAFKRAIDQMQDAVRSIQDDIARKTMSPKAYDEYAAQKKYREYLEKYPKSVADEWFRVEMARIGKKAADEEERYRKAIAAEEERYRQARQRGDDAERRVIENPYTKSPGLGTSPLVNADSRALAAMGVLEKYGISVEELQKELNSTATAKEAYQNILQRLNDKMRETSGELGDATTEATNGIGNLGDAATEGADKITSAAETVRRAFEYLAEIEEENARRKRDFQPEDEEPKIPIIYGDEFDTYAPSIPPDKRIPIEYGNEDYIPPSTFEEPLQSAAEKIREFADNMDSAPIENFQQEVQQATDSVTDSAGATQNLADAATTAGTSTNALSEKMLQTADTLDVLREKIANMPLQQPPQQPQQYDNFSSAFDDALKATATIGELTALGGLATLQPEIALLGTGIEALANTAQTLRDLAKHVPAQPTQPAQPATPQPATPQPNSPTSVDLSEIQTTLTTISQTLNTIAQEPPVDLTPLQEGLQQLAENPALAEINTSIQGMSTELSAKLAEIAQGISALAQSAGNNRQPPQVNVNVSPNINLGGAYVFDNDMKRQLTDDIATEVADAVTSAVQTATKQADYGYGN